MKQMDHSNAFCKLFEGHRMLTVSTQAAVSNQCTLNIPAINLVSITFYGGSLWTTTKVSSTCLGKLDIDESVSTKKTLRTVFLDYYFVDQQRFGHTHPTEYEHCRLLKYGGSLKNVVLYHLSSFCLPSICHN